MQHKISVQVRKVHLSMELLAKSFSADITNGISRIKTTSEAGGDLNPFLSKRTSDPIMSDGSPLSDGMLLDWGIYHMHLGEPDPTSFFVKRTGPLLFVFMQANDLFFLAVEDHKSFADQELLEIVHRNWPTLLAPYRAPSVLGFEDAFATGLSGQERIKLRAAGITMGVAMADGTFYMCPGGGVTSAKHGANAIDKAHHLLGKIRLIEERVMAHEKEVVAFLCAQLPANMSTIHLALDPSSGRIFETSMNIEIPLNLVGLRMKATSP